MPFNTLFRNENYLKLFYKKIYQQVDEMTFKCNTCNKTFGKKQHLERHERTHTGMQFMIKF